LVGHFHLPFTFHSPSEFRSGIFGLQHTPGRDLNPTPAAEGSRAYEAHLVVDKSSGPSVAVARLASERRTPARVVFRTEPGVLWHAGATD